MIMTSLYIMAPRELVRVCNTAYDELACFMDICSTWFKRWDGENEDKFTKEYLKEQLLQNTSELEDANLVLLFTSSGFGQEVWCELGRAMQRRIPVIWHPVKDGRVPLSLYNDYVFMAETMGNAISQCRRFSVE